MQDLGPCYQAAVAEEDLEKSLNLGIQGSHLLATLRNFSAKNVSGFMPINIFQVRPVSMRPTPCLTTMRPPLTA